MASRYEDEELKLARENLRSMSDKSEQLYRSGGNLDRNGEPSLTAPRGDTSFTPAPRDENKAVRANMRGPDGLDMPPMTSFSLKDRHITGDVGGRAKPKQRHITWAEPEKARKPDEAARRFTKLKIPAARPLRPSNENGATSFHFSHEAISKTRIEKTTARGTKNRRGAAADHTSYIERDGAVAKTDADQLDQVQAELLAQAKSNPGLARQLGIDPNCDEKLSVEAVQRLSKELGVDGKASVYIEREEALAHDPNGVAVLFSNISDDPVKRREFWKLVERAEGDPSADKMKLRIAGNDEFWTNVAGDKDCPKSLKTAIEAADPNEIVQVRTRDNDLVRKIMKRHGWKPRERRPSDETDAQKLAREDREAANAFGAKFEDGRGGRVQFRIVGELPYEVSHEARVKILQDFTREFEARNLPHIAVMHAPDHTNDDRNWHFHLVYHDRPATRFTGKAEDHLWELEKGAGEKKVRQREIATAALADPAIQKHVGKWDFTVPWTYRKKVSGNIKDTRPFAQVKDRDVNKRDFVPMLRRTLAHLTNRELEEAGVARRVDHRRYSAMGIHKEADEHLGTQASSLESNGVPTEAGIQNERNQWEYIQRRLASQARADQARIDKQMKAWSAALRATELSDKERATVDAQMVRWEQSERVAAEHRAIASNMEEHLDRLRSRANKVAKMSSRHLTAINEGKANKRQQASKGRYEAKLSEAEIHLAGIEIMMGQEISQIANSRAAAERHSVIAETAKLIIDGNIAAGREARIKTERSGAPVAANDTVARTPANDTAERGPAQATEPANSIRAVGNSRLEAFYKTIDQFGRRLIVGKQGIIPRDLVPQDAEVIDAPNYGRAQNRLSKIMERQEAMITGLAGAIASNPGMVKFRSEEARDDTGLVNNERFKIGTRDRTHQAAFKLFADEPEIAAELAKAEAKLLKTRDAKTVDVAAEMPGTSVPTKKTEPAKPEKAAPAPAPQKVAADHSGLIEVMRTRFLRPTLTGQGGSIELAFSKTDAALYNLPAKVVVDDKRSISRIEGIIRTHDRSMKRLTAYITKNPSKVVAGEAGASNHLSKSAPDELVEIATNFARDPELDRLMQNALVTARLEAADPRKQADAEKPKTDEAKKADENDFGLFKIVNGQIVLPTEDLPEIDPEDLRNYEPSGYGSGKPKPTKPDADKKREPATIKVDPERAHQFASKDEPIERRVLERGIDPLFDQWIDANRNGDQEQQVRISARIRADKNLRQIAQSFEPGVADTFEADWQKMEDHNRRHRQCNFGPDRDR